MGKSLSHAQTRHFSDAGFLCLRDVAPRELVERAKAQLMQDLEQPSGPMNRTAEGVAYKMYGLLERDGAYEQIIKLPRLLDALEDLLGADIVYTRNRHNHGSLNRAGENGSVVRLHRDVLRVGYISAVAYLEDTTIENGATLVVPTSHRWPYASDHDGGMWLEHIEQHEYIGLADQAVPVLARAGDVLLFEGLLFHAVADNTSGGTRASLVLGYRAVDELSGVNEQTECLVRGRDLYRGNIVVPGKPT